MSNLDRIRQLVAGVLGVPLDRVTSETTMDDLDEWDSLAQMNIVLGIEEEWNIVVPDEDVASIVSVSLIDLLIDEHAK